MYRLVLSLSVFLFCQTSFAVVPVLVPAESEIYRLFDRLDSYRCLRRTLRILKPQAYADLRRGIFLPEGSNCQAPPHLLQKTRILEPPSLQNTLSARAFFSRLDRLSLPGQSATISPTFALRDGRPTVDGGNLLLEASLAAGGGNPFGFAIGATAGWAGGFVGYQTLIGNFYLNQAYLKAYYKKLELLYGRIQPGFGDGRNGTLLFSRATYPITMFRLGLRPVWLGDVGLFSFDTWIGHQENTVAVPGANLFGLALGFRPADFLEFGIQELHQFGGTGAPRVDVSNLFRMLFYSADPGVSDSVVALHLNLWLFDHFAKLYSQWLVRNFQEESSFLVGLALPRLGQVGLTVEFVQTGLTAYSHSFWTQGLSYKDSPLGHPLGSDAQGVYVDLDIDTHSEWEPSLGVRYEARGRRATPETRYGIGALVKRGFGRYEVQVGVHYDRVTNHLFVAGIEDDVLTAHVVGKYLLF